MRRHQIAMAVIFSLATACSTGGSARVGGPSGTTANSIARAEPADIGAAKRSITLAFAGDAHFGSWAAAPAERTKVLRSISASGADAFFLVGDTVNEGNSRAEFSSALRELKTGLGNIPLAAVPGNHDAGFAGLSLWREYLGSGLEPGREYFELKWPGLRVIGLRLLGGLWGYDHEQEAWLKERLAEEAGFTIVVAHSFVYSSGYSDVIPWYDDAAAIARLAPLFKAGGVDLVVSGHNHYMELLEDDGVRYAVVGAGGGPIDPLPTYHSPKSVWFLRGKRGWLEVEIDAGSATLRFRGSGGEILYSSPGPI
jgi:3',5'-cyclic AMP phosphodiesterase CpdA